MTQKPLIHAFNGRLRHALPLLLWMAVLAPLKAAESQLDPETVNVMTAGFSRGMEAFDKGEWEQTITEMERVVTLCENYPDKAAMAVVKPRLAPVYYSLGAAAFNLPDYPKSIAAFGRFAALFPAHEKVPHARLAMARAAFMNKDFEKAAAMFVELERFPSLREQSLVIQSQCFSEVGNTAALATVVEKLTGGDITTTPRAGAVLMLAQARIKAGEFDKATVLLEQLIARRQFVENVVELNALIVALGDSQVAKEQFEQASRTYLSVTPPARVIAFQKQRIETLQRRIAANQAATARDPQAEAASLGQNAELLPVLEQAKRLLAEFEKLPDYMPGLMLRNARCWAGRDRKWEAILVNERLIKLYPGADKEREAALFANIIGYAELTRIKTCQQLCEVYLKEFPMGENAGTVAYVQGAVAMQAGDSKNAATAFGTLVDSHPDSKFIDQMYLMLGSARFNLGELDDALKAYQSYLKKFPDGPALEEAHYRTAIIPVFQGKYEEAWKALETFLKTFPTSQFAEDAEYRLMICKYAANLYEEVLTDVTKWQTNHPGGLMEPEVLSLKGDCLAALSKNQEAADAYLAAAPIAATDDVLNYTLNEASKILQKLGDMDRLSKMWVEFIELRPDHPAVVAGIYWIGKAKTREGKVDEAKAITANQLKRCMNDPKNESVEMLLQQLAQLCWKRPRPATPPVAEESTAAALTEPPPPPPWDAMAELQKLIEPLETSVDASGRPRLAFARMELLKLLKKQKEVDELMLEISAAPPEVLSPQLLALSGEFLQGRKRDAEAALRYNHLKDNFLKSAWLDYAYSGLGAMALARKDLKTALEFYTLATDEYAGGKLKDSTLGLAMTLLESARFPEAKKLFEQVAGTREWRGEATAQAVFCLGMVEERQGNLPEAIAHYQRVFSAYQKYTFWVEKAYIQSAVCFDKLGKRKEAVAHLNEVLRDDKLGYDVKTTARGLLQKWGADS